MTRRTPELVFCWVGRTSAPYARTGVDEYLRRLERYARPRVLRVPDEPRSGRYSAEHRVEREGAAILGRLDGLQHSWVAVLDPRGATMTSTAFATALKRTAVAAARPAVFVVGGPDGLSSPVRERADRLIGLTRWTVPHDMARLLLLEQVYRAMTIIHGHPYDR